CEARLTIPRSLSCFQGSDLDFAKIGQPYNGTGNTPDISAYELLELDSTCGTGLLGSVNQHSPHLYEFDPFETLKKGTQPQGPGGVGGITFNFEEEVLGTNNEVSFDLQSLIEDTCSGFPSDDQLLSDILGDCKPNLTAVSTTGGAFVQALSPSAGSTASNHSNISESMPQPTDLETLTSWVVKQEGSPPPCEVSTATNTRTKVPVTVTEADLPTSPTNRLKARPPGRGKKRVYEKNSEEYRQRRERNNVAVRKSRDKAKLKQIETECKVKELSDQNQTLQKKLDLLTKELNVLKGLFINTGATIPNEYKDLLKDLCR
ncbi:uncharacterized protein LOC106159324, partial [Lingula anatina]|uniref:Uncharacterized protein LOC106159324 n=1 Tax=Lingula anatina TaxID=7574 RepID=A0A1S3HYE9_LINAN